jgi:hypothetical protein
VGGKKYTHVVIGNLNGEDLLGHLGPDERII